MNHSDICTDIEPYYLLRTALALFKKTPGELTETEREQAAAQARNEYNLEARVLASPEAAAAIVTEPALDNAVKAIRDRFDDQQSYLEELTRNGLNPQSLKRALERQCKVENVLESVAARACDISDVEIGVFYHMHPEKFRRPEQRGTKHILITINEDFPENSREKALQRINEIAEKLKRKPQKFAELAARHSECPTALQGGELGVFTRGQLYKEIEDVLFNLKEGQISEVVETEAGFHIVMCSKIHYAETISLKKAQPKIRKLMQERSRRNCQRAWLAGLPNKSTVHSLTN